MMHGTVATTGTQGRGERHVHETKDEDAKADYRTQYVSGLRVYVFCVQVQFNLETD